MALKDLIGVYICTCRDEQGVYFIHVMSSGEVRLELMVDSATIFIRPRQARKALMKAMSVYHIPAGKGTVHKLKYTEREEL